MARTIRRYENRKLYDTEASAYITLAGLANLVRSGETIVVLDNVTGEDLTAQTLTQVILEEGRQGRTLLTSDLLHDLLHRSGTVLESGMSTIRHGVDDLVQSSVRRVQTFLKRPEPGELEALREQLARLESMLEHLIHTNEPSDGASAAQDDQEVES